jgi:hypothetical protein
MLANIEAFANSNKLRQGVWSFEHQRDGARLACFLGAADPAVKSSKAKCLAELAPTWLLRAFPRLYDHLSPDFAGRTSNTLYMTSALRAMPDVNHPAWHTVRDRFTAYIIRNIASMNLAEVKAHALYPEVDRIRDRIVGALLISEPDFTEHLKELVTLLDSVQPTRTRNIFKMFRQDPAMASFRLLSAVCALAADLRDPVIGKADDGLLCDILNLSTGYNLAGKVQRSPTDANWLALAGLIRLYAPETQTKES